jgi:hypothetical protein
LVLGNEFYQKKKQDCAIPMIPYDDGIHEPKPIPPDPFCNAILQVEAEVATIGKIYTENPSLYFSSLVQLAKVLKIETGEPGAFDDKPRPREEALRKLEERAGADARRLFEAFLRKIDKRSRFQLVDLA